MRIRPRLGKLPRRSAEIEADCAFDCIQGASNAVRGKNERLLTRLRYAWSKASCKRCMSIFRICRMGLDDSSRLFWTGIAQPLA